jgi:4-aminobutyrate aminotransferase-like enzyme
VRDKKTKEPLPRRVTEQIFLACVRRGLLTMAYAPSFRIQPALTIDAATAKNGLELLADVFDEVARQGTWKS